MVEKKNAKPDSNSEKRYQQITRMGKLNEQEGEKKLEKISHKGKMIEHCDRGTETKSEREENKDTEI